MENIDGINEMQMNTLFILLTFFSSMKIVSPIKIHLGYISFCPNIKSLVARTIETISLINRIHLFDICQINFSLGARFSVLLVDFFLLRNAAKDAQPISMAHRREHMDTLWVTRLVDVSSTLIGRQLMPPLQHKRPILNFHTFSA